MRGGKVQKNQANKPPTLAKTPSLGEIQEALDGIDCRRGVTVEIVMHAGRIHYRHDFGFGLSTHDGAGFLAALRALPEVSR